MQAVKYQITVMYHHSQVKCKVDFITNFFAQKNSISANFVGVILLNAKGSEVRGC